MNWIIVIIILMSFSMRCDSKEIVPDMKFQKALKPLAGCNGKDEYNKRLKTVMAICGGDREKLLLQAIYFSGTAGENNMGQGLVAFGIAWHGHPPFTKNDILRIILPYLETKEPGVRQITSYLLDNIEFVDPNAEPLEADFSPYEAVIAVNKTNPPVVIVQRMYRELPGKALETMLKVYGSESDQASRDIVLAARHVDEIESRQNKGLSKSTDKAEAISLLQNLVTHETWWVRLYVAKMMKRNVAFRDLLAIQVLKEKPHPLVRQVLQEFSSD